MLATSVSAAKSFQKQKPSMPPEKKDAVDGSAYPCVVNIISMHF